MSTERRDSYQHEDTAEEHLDTTTTVTADPEVNSQTATDTEPSDAGNTPTSEPDDSHATNETPVQGQQTEEASTGEDDSSDQTSPALPPKKTESRVRVSIVEDVQETLAAPSPKRISSGRLRMERELSRMMQSDENERLRQRARRKKEMRKAVEGVEKERQTKGVTLTPDVEACRDAIRGIMREEESVALAKEQQKLRNETKALQKQIQAKYALKEKRPHQDLVALATDFYQGKVKDKDGIPEHVRRELTRHEIEDLRVVFDMFDAKGKGFITSNDVRRAASMLGFKAKKEVFSGMIEELTGDMNGRVTFSHFLQFVVKGQGDGDDPLDAILQCFRMLDRDQKGYITAADLRHAADSQKVPLSNRAIREMIQEADITGDSEVTLDEFIHLMLQSSMFRTSP